VAAPTAAGGGVLGRTRMMVVHEKAKNKKCFASDLLDLLKCSINKTTNGLRKPLVHINYGHHVMLVLSLLTKQQQELLRRSMRASCEKWEKRSSKNNDPCLRIL
jgi:hypothetical protein